MAEYNQTLMRETPALLEAADGDVAVVIWAGIRFTILDFVDGRWIIETEDRELQRFGLECSIAYEDLPELAWEDRGTPQAN